MLQVEKVDLYYGAAIALHIDSGHCSIPARYSQSSWQRAITQVWIAWMSG